MILVLEENLQKLYLKKMLMSLHVVIKKNSLMELKNQFKHTNFHHHCFPVQLDISNYESCENAATFVENLLKIKNEKLYALVNNAGVSPFFFFFFFSKFQKWIHVGGPTWTAENMLWKPNHKERHLCSNRALIITE